MAKGGIVMVDDVKNKDIWDGSYQAFMEFVNQNDFEFQIIGSKSGIIKF